MLKKLIVGIGFLLLLSHPSNAQIALGPAPQITPQPLCTNGQVITYNTTTAKWDTCASNGSGAAPVNATYITQTTNSTLTNEQALSALATGILKSTTTTGVVSIAIAGTDYQIPITGTDTRVCFFDGTAISCNDAGLVYNKTTDTLQVPFIAAASGTDGVDLFLDGGEGTAGNGGDFQGDGGLGSVNGGAWHGNGGAGTTGAGGLWQGEAGYGYGGAGGSWGGSAGGGVTTGGAWIGRAGIGGVNGGNWTGGANNGDSGHGGDTLLLSGLGGGGRGGDINLTSGQGSTNGGGVFLSAGRGLAGTGGDIEIAAGIGSTTGGNILLEPGGGGTSGSVQVFGVITGADTTTSGYYIGNGSGLSVANVGANSCGTTAATIAGGASSFEITVGATAGSQCRVTLPAAPNSWNCAANDSTTAVLTRTTPVDTTHVDFKGVFTAGDVITGVCIAR